MSSLDSYVSLSLSNPTMGNDWGKRQGEIADFTPQHVGCGDGRILIQMAAAYRPEMEETGAGASRPDDARGRPRVWPDGRGRVRGDTLRGCAGRRGDQLLVSDRGISLSGPEGAEADQGRRVAR